MGKSIFVDIPRCIDCRACEIACAREHGGIPLISIVVIEEEVPVPISVPMSCRQCEKAPCIAVCTPKALIRSKKGAIIVDPAKCNSCRLCIMACPQKAIQIDLIRKIVSMCDLCLARTEGGRAPACVSTCPTKALIYDDFDHLVQQFKEKAARHIARAGGLADDALSGRQK